MSVLRRTCFSGSAASTLAFRNCACEGLYGRSLAATSKGRGFHTTSFTMSKKSHKEMVERKKQQERQKEKLEDRKKKKLKALKKKHKVATVAVELRPVGLTLHLQQFFLIFTRSRIRCWNLKWSYHHEGRECF